MLETIIHIKSNNKVSILENTETNLKTIAKVGVTNK